MVEKRYFGVLGNKMKLLQRSHASLAAAIDADAPCRGVCWREPYRCGLSEVYAAYGAPTVWERERPGVLVGGRAKDLDADSTYSMSAHPPWTIRSSPYANETRVGAGFLDPRIAETLQGSPVDVDRCLLDVLFECAKSERKKALQSPRPRRGHGNQAGRWVPVACHCGSTPCRVATEGLMTGIRIESLEDCNGIGHYAFASVSALRTPLTTPGLCLRCCSGI